MMGSSASTLAGKAGEVVNKVQAMKIVKAHGMAWNDELEETWDRLVASVGVRSVRKGVDASKVRTNDLAQGIQDLIKSRGGRTPLADDGEVKDDEAAASTGRGLGPQCPFAGIAQPVPLSKSGNTHTVSQPTRDLLEAIGGRDRLVAVTSRFYPTMFRDRHLVQFVTDQDEPHPQRLADWVAEKMSGTRYWSSKLHDRPRDQAHDRSSAHFRAWNSPHRARENYGQHFKLDDAVMWMRLMFWACREEGLADTPFFDWYVRFISHFVAVYERRAPPHARAAAEWSADPANIAQYEKDGFLMKDVIAKFGNDW